MRSEDHQEGEGRRTIPRSIVVDHQQRRDGKGQVVFITGGVKGRRGEEKIWRRLGACCPASFYIPDLLEAEDLAAGQGGLDLRRKKKEATGRPQAPLARPRPARVSGFGPRTSVPGRPFRRVGIERRFYYN